MFDWVQNFQFSKKYKKLQKRPESLDHDEAKKKVCNFMKEANHEKYHCNTSGFDENSQVK